jgi:hypothetical protein
MPQSAFLLKDNRNINTEIAFKRDEWLNLRREFPDANISELKAKYHRVYRFLRKYNPLWLKENSPEITTRKPVYDWNLRDEDLAKEVVDAASVIKNYQGKPVQVTKTEIARITNEESLIMFYLHRLPQTVI